jgi:hypothetical protein
MIDELKYWNQKIKNMKRVKTFNHNDYINSILFLEDKNIVIFLLVMKQNFSI